MDRERAAQLALAARRSRLRSRRERQRAAAGARRAPLPTGFEYGYGGSGPADLARSILVDFLELRHAPDELPVCHQQFKRAFIEPADDRVNRLEISGPAIGAWVRAQPAT